MCSLNTISGGIRLREGYFFNNNNPTSTIELFQTLSLTSVAYIKQKGTQLIVLLTF